MSRNATLQMVHDKTNKRFVSVSASETGVLNVQDALSKASIDDLRTKIGTDTSSSPLSLTALTRVQKDILDNRLTTCVNFLDKDGPPSHLSLLNDKVATVITKITEDYESQTLAGASNLLVYGAKSGTSVDVSGYRHVVISVKCAATAGNSTLQNLAIMYSLDDVDYHQGEVITLKETPGNAGEYTGILRITDIGFRYWQLIAVGVTASPTAYTIKYSRSN